MEKLCKEKHVKVVYLCTFIFIGESGQAEIYSIHILYS